MPANWTCPDTGNVFATGAMPTPPGLLLAAPPFIVTAPPPPQVAYVPKYRSYYGNDRYGICVTAEEAFAKSCFSVHGKEVVIDDQTVIGWARGHGVLNGAMLDDVLNWMAQKGFQIGSQLYNDGQKAGVNFEDQTILQAAIAQGPVKIAIAASALPGGAGSRDGWYKLGSNTRFTDHAVALCGYGPAGWLYSQLNVPLPPALQPNLPGYLLYTWSTIGFVDHAWILGTCEEAWVRNPTTVGIPPLPEPTPPTPPPPPGPGPQAVKITLTEPLPAGDYLLIQMVKA